MNLVASLFLVLTWTGCYSRVVTGDPIEPRSLGPWSVDGVRIGMNRNEVEKVLGAPRSPRGPDQSTSVWEPPKDVAVTFDPAGKANDILGHNLQDLAGRTVLWAGAGEEQVLQVLGEGRVSRHYRPTGSGVISLGRTLVGTSHEYEDDVAVYTVSVMNDQVSWIRSVRREVESSLGRAP